MPKELPSITFEPLDRVSTRSTKSVDELPKGSNILVVGAGVFGCWTALNLLRSGYKVSLVDPWGPGNSNSSSGGESRLNRAVYGRNTKYFQMAVESREDWADLESSSNSKLVYTTGVAWIFPKGEEVFLNDLKSIIDEFDQPSEIIAVGELATKFPSMFNEDLLAVLVEKNAGYIRAKEGTIKTMEKFVAEGGEHHQAFIDPKTISSYENLHEVKLSDGSIQFDRCVFACGPWLKDFFPDLLGPKFTVTRQEVYYFTIPPRSVSDFSSLPGWVEWDPTKPYYGMPSRDFRGFKIAHDSRGIEVDPKTMDRSPTQELVDKTRKYLTYRFPALGSAPLAESRTCQYSNTIDGNFIIDSHPVSDDIWIVGGGSGHGFKHGPAVGRLAANLVTGKVDKDADFLLSD